MTSTPLIMAMDQGTTSSRAIIFDDQLQMICSSQEEFEQLYPNPGWVEHDPNAIWATSMGTARAALKDAEPSNGTVAAIGLTNQRETVIVWDRQTGTPIHNAIVWQDRRTATVCEELRRGGHEDALRQKTGLLLDPYFSATKIAWILDHVDGARQRAERGQLAAGTIDTFLIWKLTGGKVHATDETNAARTCLFNIRTGDWDEELLSLFGVPKGLLPTCYPSMADFGETDPALFGRPIPIRGVAGDQQSAAFGQGCVRPGMTKSTYGTGCFMLMHTGHEAKLSSHRLLTTRACRTGNSAEFALEGSIFMAGAIAQWLRDEVQIIESSPQSEAMAASLPSNQGVYLVPAFTGLGAPHWDSEARGSLFGMTRQTGRAAIVRAGLEAVAYQTLDLIKALSSDGFAPDTIRIDGGMSQNNWLMKFVSDLTGTPLERPSNIETTAIGATVLAGVQSGVWADPAAVFSQIVNYTRFTPSIETAERNRLVAGWDNAVKATRYLATLSQ